MLYLTGMQSEARGSLDGLWSRLRRKPSPVVILQDDCFDATASIAVCALTTDPTLAP